MKKTVVILMTALLLAPALAPAQQKGGVELRSVAEVDVAQKNEKGEKVVKRVEASKANVVPGDTVIYTVTYLNSGDDPATDVVIKNPVPEHMVYLDKSAEGAGTRIDFSVDHGKSFGPADTLQVKGARGKERQGTAADITHIRWVLEQPLEKGSKGSVSFRAKVK